MKLTVKPIIGKPKLIAKGATKEVDFLREVEAFLTSTKTHLNGQEAYVSSWLNLMNRIVFLSSLLTRGLLDSNLIEQQTDG